MFFRSAFISASTGIRFVGGISEGFAFCCTNIGDISLDDVSRHVASFFGVTDVATEYGSASFQIIPGDPAPVALGHNSPAQRQRFSPHWPKRRS